MKQIRTRAIRDDGWRHSTPGCYQQLHHTVSACLQSAKSLSHRHRCVVTFSPVRSVRSQISPLIIIIAFHSEEGFFLFALCLYVQMTDYVRIWNETAEINITNQMFLIGVFFIYTKRIFFLRFCLFFLFSAFQQNGLIVRPRVLRYIRTWSRGDYDTIIFGTFSCEYKMKIIAFVASWIKRCNNDRWGFHGRNDIGQMPFLYSDNADCQTKIVYNLRQLIVLLLVTSNFRCMLLFFLK